MESTGQKNLERVVSQKAFQMGNSFPCQICIIGFFCGVCLTYCFLAVLTSSGTLSVQGVSLSGQLKRISFENLTLEAIYKDRGSYENSASKETERRNSQETDKWSETERISLLYSYWTAKLKGSEDDVDEILRKLGHSRSSIANAPHLENCKISTEVYGHLDNRIQETDMLPPWTTWKGHIGVRTNGKISFLDKQEQHVDNQANSGDAYPPWIVGSDEDNFPLTRKVQRDLWIHQHPSNCSDPRVRFLIADWETLPGFGLGAQLAGMCGLLGIAVNEQRVLVTKYFNRADHDGCKGSVRSHWSCYFFPETSMQCRDRALELMNRHQSWKDGIITGNINYTSKEIWSGKIPRAWGEPWSYLQPTTEIKGNLLTHHRKMDRRWWRAQAVRYLMRFRIEYTCDLLNNARHSAFGLAAAKMVHESLSGERPKTTLSHIQSDMELYVWASHKPWIPRPLLSMHVRMGDKACEMEVVEFKEYMRLANRIRRRFPNLKSIWLSTEMQGVIDETKLYPNWKFYYTNVTRQVGNITMATYEASLGRKTSTNYPLINFLMAAEADFFVGALGSTWSFLIDGMRNTGGKVMSGYLSVNKDRFW